MKRLIPFLLCAMICAAGIHTFAKSEITISKSAFKEDRDVKNFNGVVSGGPIDVVIKLGSTEGLRFEGDAEAISTLVTEVKGNILIIRPKNSWTSWAKKYENKKITAYVTAKDITSLTMSGNGSIKAEGTLHATEFAATLSGSGTIKANIDTDELVAVISGSGSLALSGKADEASVNISGSGKLDGKTLSLNELSTRISGSGNVNVKVDGSISAFIIGSGHVYYSGNASVEKKGVGSGGVSKI
ncbi:head GIN domain-containing protein [Pedobacter metabolipauper]|uniref:Putative autotransporter adhesin-like protein n=1 Tax=Pedobacter metabolipauper TaxID=425513 RepID=A0A4R6SWQ1_9SPHI|nr:head GIN domain-containing protein [Pedobacter metabolipauper]TDQ08809.1 putative autotransporter adhesin-like protein [Pedobacter metabolipauper]